MVSEELTGLSHSSPPHTCVDFNVWPVAPLSQLRRQVSYIYLQIDVV